MTGGADADEHRGAPGLLLVAGAAIAVRFVPIPLALRLSSLGARNGFASDGEDVYRPLAELLCGASILGAVAALARPAGRAETSYVLWGLVILAALGFVDFAFSRGVRNGKSDEPSLREQWS